MFLKYASNDNSHSFLSSNEENDCREEKSEPWESTDSIESKRILWLGAGENVEMIPFHASVMLFSVLPPLKW